MDKTLLINKLQNLPTDAGIYQYFNKDNKLLYVGKAKNLKNRVKSYFRFTPYLQPSSNLSVRISNMINEVYDLRYIIVNSEHDALILENTLIKQLKPKYNILLRDDKTYPYIYLDTNKDFPRLEITRKIIKDKHIKYFGPYSSGAKDILNSIYEIVPLVQKKANLKHQKACIFYQIKRCLAPCENKISKEQYKLLIDEALDYLLNKQKLISKLKQTMEKYSDQLRFEEALKIRQRIETISKSTIKSTLDFAKDEDIDLFYVYIQHPKAIVIKMFVRHGKLTLTTHNFVTTTNITTYEDIYKSAIINYYLQDLPMVASNIIVGHTLEIQDELENFISNKHNKKVSIITPQRGIKKQLIELSLKNAQELFKIDNQNKYTNISAQIQELFELSIFPKRIEVFDNSQMMGQAKVASMVVWDNNSFAKDDYRVYNLQENDEYSQMKELLTRRAKSFEKNPAPNLWVLDGGKALLMLGYDIIDSVGIDIDIIAISKEKVDAKAYRSKGKARDIIYTKNNIYKLEPSDVRLQFIQRLRDEAHNKAISFHKKQKRKEDQQISLLDIKGIGEAKIKKLLNYFGTFENIKKASIKDLEVVLNSKDSQNVFQYFQSISLNDDQKATQSNKIAKQ
jgi:excinuclease ABC subunit C